MRALSTLQVLLLGSLAEAQWNQPQGFRPNQNSPGYGYAPNQYQQQGYAPNQYPPGYGYQAQGYRPNQAQPRDEDDDDQEPQPQPRPQAQPRPQVQAQPRPNSGQNQGQGQGQSTVEPDTPGYDSAPEVGAYAQPVSGPQIGGPIWRPQIGQKIQVILDRRVMPLDPDAPLMPAQADIWDLDLFETDKQVIDVLHSKGKRVFCYLSIGGTESWRPDAASLPASDLGDQMPKWKGERYLNIKSPSVWVFMQNRIRLAYEKGCDAIDPDNVDPFNDDFERGGGFNLTEADSIDYLRKVSVEAARYGMSMGMKNAETLIPKVADFIDFAVNEECTTYSNDEDGCLHYEILLQKNKPVFHFEYVNVDLSRGNPAIQSVYKDWANMSTTQIRQYYCMQNNFGYPYLPTPQVGALFSTVLKKLDLGGWVMYCDGTHAETATSQSLGDPDKIPGGTRGWEQRGGKGGKAKGNGGGPELVNGNQGPL